MRDRRWLLFLFLAYLISWGIYALAKWTIGIDGPIRFMITGALFMCGPALAAWIVMKRPPALDRHALGITIKGIRWKWVGLALLIALALPLLTLLFNAVFGNMLGVHGFGTTSVSMSMMAETVAQRLQEAGMDPGKADAQMDMLSDLGLTGPVILVLSLVAGAIAGSTINLPFALGEEIGWRGLLLDGTRSWGLLRHVLVTGVAWGLWHAPLILEGLNYPDHPWTGVFWMCGLTTAMAVPLAWVRVRSRCIWAPGMLHGSVNAMAGAVILFTKDASPLFGSPAGLSGMLALAVISLVLLAFDPSFPRDFRAAMDAPTAAPSPGS